MYKIDSKWKFSVWHRELCDNLEGWDVVELGGRFKREGTYVYLWLIHVDVWHKPTQYCKAIILQLKINKFQKARWVSWFFTTVYLRGLVYEEWDFRSGSFLVSTHTKALKIQTLLVSYFAVVCLFSKWHCSHKKGESQENSGPRP